MKPDISISLYEFDEAYRNEGYSLLCGIDEAGRGPLAGPVCVAAVILDPENPIEWLNDSKKLTEKRRELLFPEIKEKALSYSVVFVSHAEIDRINILQATLKGMAEAANSLSVVPDFVLVDGDRKPDWKKEIPSKCVIHGDEYSASIAAASILAKVSRDHHMQKMSELYLGYGFEKHKGYGTEAHYQAIKEYGISPIHRKTFLKSYNPNRLGRKELGNWGENYAATQLKEQGFTILEQNYQIKGGEIDIIAQKDTLLLFVEVKCARKKSTFYAPREKVSEAKQKRIIKTAKTYLIDKNMDLCYRFDVFEILVDDENPEIKVESFVWIKDAFAEQECQR